MRPTVASIVLLGLLATAPAGAHAQRAPERRGFWSTPSLGMALTFSDPAYSDPLYEGRGDNPMLDLYLSARMGGSVSQQVLIGGETAVWGAGDGLKRGHVGATLLYYPSPTGGLFVHGLAGMAYRIVEYPVWIGALGERVGVSLALGVGYDVQLGRNFFLTPCVDTAFQYVDDDWATSLVLAAGATWH
jgi:hypothetical protein